MEKCIIFLSFVLVGWNCNTTNEKPHAKMDKVINPIEAPTFGLQEAQNLIALPLKCFDKEYPNKISYVLGNDDDLKLPKDIYPVFYGCFDWHSAVHGYWSMIRLLKQFPEMKQAERVRSILKNNMTKENMEGEAAFFEREINAAFERTYGWNWFLKLVQELHTWDDPLARELEENCKPLTDLMVQRYKEFLPKLVYPIRVGEHTNTAFGLTFAYDFAVATGEDALRELIEQRAKDFYLKDKNCPLDWEPSGYDFLSPCLEEVNIMRRVLDKEAFIAWLEGFLPQMKTVDFKLEVGKVGDRKDGKLVHLDGLNFSRAWSLYALANSYPEYVHLKDIADEHVNNSLPNLVGDSYEGGHWLGSFAIYALSLR